RIERALRPVALATAVALAALVAVTHGMNRNNALVQVYGYSIIAVASAALVAAAALPRPPRWLDPAPLPFFGKYSYGIYIVHAPLKHAAVHLFELDPMLAAHPLATELGFIAVMSAVSVGAALLTWRLIEKPFMAMKGRWAPR